MKPDQKSDEEDQKWGIKWADFQKYEKIKHEMIVGDETGRTQLPGRHDM